VLWLSSKGYIQSNQSIIRSFTGSESPTLQVSSVNAAKQLMLTTYMLYNNKMSLVLKHQSLYIMPMMVNIILSVSVWTVIMALHSTWQL